MPGLKRIYNIFRYGVGPGARKRKRAAKHKVHQTSFDSDDWQRGQDLAKRHYASYEEYVKHQATKLDRIENRLRSTEAQDLIEFKQRFQACEPLAESHSVLCLGARLGTEVQALHELGYFAVGIDLNPGEKNSYVLPGDFHHIVFPDQSVDAIYCNALDHVFDLQRVLAEIVRLLRVDGIFIADLMPGYEEGFIPLEYEATHWKTVEALISEIVQLSGLVVIDTGQNQGHSRRNQWRQVVFRKSAN